MVLRKPSSLEQSPTSSGRTLNMQARNSSDRAQDGSDTDDWTLVTPPQSKSASPELQTSRALGQVSVEDGSNPLDAKTPLQDEASNRPDHNDPSEKFEEVALNDDEEDNSSREVRQTPSCGRKVLIIAQPFKLDPQSDRSEELSFMRKKAETNRDLVKKQKRARVALAKSSNLRAYAAEKLSKSTLDRLADQRKTSWPIDERIFLAFAATVSVYCLFSLGYMLGQSEGGLNRSRESLKKILKTRDGAANLVYLDPSDHAFSKLKLLDDALLECIQRQNPRHEIDYNADLADTRSKSKPIMGLVCYEKEANWRKEFQKLKFEHNFDIWKTLKRVRQQLTNEMLEIYHPGLRFMLITNQLDWLSRLDSERRDRELERLKAEVHELRRAPTSPTKSGDVSADNNRKARQQHSAANGASQQAERLQSSHNALVSLQGENRRLRVENEMLKQSLGEKAGTIYIKQSIELEKCERENNAMRQFHRQVAHEVSKGLRQIDLQITDFGAVLNEQEEGLSARLNQTRGYLMRLVEETGHLAARNKTFEVELNEARLLKALVVREARNIIEDDQTLRDKSEQEISIANITAGQELGTTSEAGSASSLTAEQLRQLDNFRCRGTSECLATKVNWLMKRAKLREKLRKSQSKMSDLESHEAQSACHTKTKNSGHRQHHIWRRECVSPG